MNPLVPGNDEISQRDSHHVFGYSHHHVLHTKPCYSLPSSLITGIRANHRTNAAQQHTDEHRMTAGGY